jgi:hypothetical protein
MDYGDFLGGGENSTVNKLSPEKYAWDKALG